MPRTKRPEPLYQRGKYTLFRREGRTNLEIEWYDPERGRNRSVSARTPDLRPGKLELDRRYLADEGETHCPTCHRPWDTTHSPLLSVVIGDYLILQTGKAGVRSITGRLGHVLDYLLDRPTTRCAEVDERWVAAFRKWLLARPYTKGAKTYDRALGGVEGCVLQLAAAINSVRGQEAGFKPIAMEEVARSPGYRADVATLAAMFRFALAEPHRNSLLRYLRMAVATWARPDAIFEVTPAQWFPAAGVLDLNTPNRRQTNKHRPKVPIARQFAPLLTSGDAFLSVVNVRKPWEKMREALGLPLEREAGEKLVRRSMATIARKRIGEAHWRQGEIMLGHAKASTSDIYALPDPANLGLALAATESIIDDIEQLVPSAFHRSFTADGPAIRVIRGGKKS